MLLNEIEKINNYKWLIPQKNDMRVPGILFISEQLLHKALSDNAPSQIINVAKLPGIVKYSLAMPDVHWGYGAPIGGVGAFDAEDGVIAPGFVGYDICCGVRLLKTNLQLKDIQDHLGVLLNSLFIDIPSGVGSESNLALKKKELEKVLVEGVRWAVKNGFGTHQDIEHIEDHGTKKNANPDNVSSRAYERGRTQLGTLGSGNHFLEIQQITDIYEKAIASKYGISEGQITVMVHSGSRGLGYQVCADYLDRFGKVSSNYGIKLPDRQLACAPANSKEGRQYFEAMNAAANYAFTNRQIMAHRIRQTFSQVLEVPWEQLDMNTVYDVSHNICNLEKHMVGGKERELYIHRKGATRSFPKGHPALPERYKDTGQPVIIPGTMGTSSYILVGTEKAMDETWGSTCHGAGRTMSRHQALKESLSRNIPKELANKGILIRGASNKGLAEEMPDAYKSIDEVIKAVEGAGLSQKIARMAPIAVIKG